MMTGTFWIDRKPKWSEKSIYPLKYWSQATGETVLIGLATYKQ